MRRPSDEELAGLALAELEAFPGLIPTQIVASAAFLPVPQTAAQREVEARLGCMADDLVRRQGTIRRPDQERHFRRKHAKAAT